MTKPNFLIVGAAKSGTTSAYKYLKQHPDVYMPDWKEPSFFAPPEAGGLTTEEEYMTLFENAGKEKAVGEASVAYLYDPGSPEKIKDFLGLDLKILIFLRNPADMAYSNWGHQKREGFEPLSFEDAIESEDDRLKDPDFFKKVGCYVGNMAYIARARYAEQIERFDALFSKANIKIFIYEEFFQPDLPLWEELCDFLEIDPAHKPAPSVHNAAGKMRSKMLQRILRERMAWKEPLKALLPLKWREKIKSGLERCNRVKTALPPMSANTRQMLKTRFAGDIAWVENRLGRSLETVWS